MQAILFKNKFIVSFVSLIVLAFSYFITGLNITDAQVTSSSPKYINDPKRVFCLSASGVPLKAGDAQCDKDFKTTFSTTDYLVVNKFFGICRSENKTTNGYLVKAPNVVNDIPACPAVEGVLFKSYSAEQFLNFNTSPSPNTNATRNSTNSTEDKIATSGDCEGLVKSGPLCLPKNPFSNSSGLANTSSVGDLAKKVINFLLWFAGIVAVIMIIYGGYQTMTAGGNTDQATNGRKTLTNAIIGLIIVVFSYTVVQVVTSFITSGN